MRIFLLFFLVTNITFSFAQTVQNNISGDGQMNAVLKFTGDIINTIKPDGIAGSPLLSDNWDTGYVKFTGNRIATKIPLQYNLTNNTVYFQRDGSRYKFVDRVIEFSFATAVNNNYSQHLYRSNYPSNGNLNDLTFYEVAAEGVKYQFLKYGFKTVREHFVWNAPAQKEYHYREEWYIYDNQLKTFHPVSNKKSILAAMPQYKNQIEALCDKNKWSLKEAAQIVQLVRELN